MRLRVTGNRPLNGVYRPSGNANAAQALIAAALLTDAPVTLHNVPRTLSTLSMIKSAETVGVALEWQDDNTLIVHGGSLARRVLSQTDSDASVGVLLLVAPLLVRRRHVRLEVDFPLNRIRTHLEALRDLGIDVLIDGDDAVELKCETWEHKDIVLTQASVTATAMILMLAASTGKDTIIRNAACEPHVRELAGLLVAMGASIDGIGSNVLHVRGVSVLGGAEATVSFDYIEAGSAAAIAAMCGGRVQIDGVRAADMRVIAKIFWRLGIDLDLEESTLYIPKHEQLTLSDREEDEDLSIETAPWYGFPSDLVSVATVIATQTRGTTLIHEKMFNNRLLFIDKLKAMGAQIVLCDPHRAIVMGKTPLHGIYMDTPDVRAGIGMLAAALIADGESVIDNAGAFEQTFSGVFAKLQALNAAIVIE